MHHEKREFCNQEIEMLLLRVKTLASISLTVRRENAKLINFGTGIYLQYLKFAIQLL